MSGTPRGPREVYDAVAGAYDAALRDELEAKPLDRALLDAVSELATGGPLADVGCGPGHVTRYLGARHHDVVGLDLSPAMVSIARAAAPGSQFAVASMLELPAADGAWAGLVAMYSIIHLDEADRRCAFAEFARVLRPGGRALVAFHVDTDDLPVGSVNHLDDWFGRAVDLDGYFLDPDAVAAQLTSTGFTIEASILRGPGPQEFPSRRCYLLARSLQPAEHVSPA